VIVVSNTSPIINLACINSLDILQKLYGQIYIPSAVFYEITNNDLPGSYETKTYNWIIQEKLSDRSVYESLFGFIHEGESEAIGLSIEMKADLLLLDEKKARLCADDLGIEYTGLIGILRTAKHEKIISFVKPYLDKLIKEGFWIQKDLYNKIISDENE
jgi:predicted nucleic acid-binding protein